MKLKASGVNKAHLVVISNSPDKPCPGIEFDWDDFYDGVVLSMDEADQIIEMLEGLEGVFNASRDWAVNELKEKTGLPVYI